MNNFFDDRPCLTQSEIKNYLSDALTDEQRFSVENHLIDCPLCSDAVDGFREHSDMLEELTEQLPAQVIAGGTTEPVERNIKAHSVNWFRMAAVFAGLIIFTALIYQYFANSAGKRIFAGAYNLLPPPESQLRSVGDSSQTELPDEAMIDYGQHKFQEAAAAFEERLKAYPKDSQTYLYAGICYLELGNLNKASDYLMKARINSEQFYPEASWYLALTHIRMGANNEALKLLEELSSTENDYTQKAKELQAELNR